MRDFLAERHSRLGRTAIVQPCPQPRVDNYLERAATESRRSPAGLGLLAMAYGEQGLDADTRRLVDELRTRSATETVPPGAIALAHLGAGDRMNAISSLEEAYATHDNYAIYMCVDPLMDPLRTEPKFQAVCARIHGGANTTN